MTASEADAAARNAAARTRPRLTPDGWAWAVRHAGTSMLARVAIAGEGWPDHHVRTAVEVCNEAARRDR